MHVCMYAYMYICMYDNDNDDDDRREANRERSMSCVIPTGVHTIALRRRLERHRVWSTSVSTTHVDVVQRVSNSRRI